MFTNLGQLTCSSTSRDLDSNTHPVQMPLLLRHKPSKMTALALCEIVRNVLENLSDVSDLLACACVNKVWNEEALRILYRGSLTDTQFRSPDIESLNCLLVASRERFAFNMGFVKHLLLHPNAPSNDEIAHPTRRIACLQKCRALRRRHDTELMFSSRRTCLSSLTIPFEIMGEDFSQAADLLVQTSIEFLAIDISYCGLLADCFSPQPGSGVPMARRETSTRRMVQWANRV